MTERLSQRLKHVVPSASMGALAEVARLRREGAEILSLSIGEPDFPTPTHVIETAVDALRRGETGYRPTNGIPALRDAIRARFAMTGLDYGEPEVTIGSGAKQLIFAAFAATIDEGDEIVVPVPYWVSYPDIGKIFGARVVELPSRPEHGFKLTPELLAGALTPRSRWLCLNSPNNPSGAVYSQDELAALGAVLADYPDCLVLSDEIYEHLIYDDRKFIPFAAANPAMKSRVLTVNGVSKAYSMTGFRLGYAGGPPWLIAGINMILTQDTTCPTSISQLAAVAALTGDQRSLAANCREYEARRDRFVAALNTVPGLSCASPEGAFYAFASVASLVGARTPDGVVLTDDIDIARYFLLEGKVAAIAGSAFGVPDYIRFSFATSNDILDRAVENLTEAVARLQLPVTP